MSLINIRVNEEQQQLPAGSSLSQLLHELGIDQSRRGIALCLNLQVVPNSDWNSTALQDGDRIDIVTAAPGG